MGIIECDHIHCKSDICGIYNDCETRKKHGTKTADLTPLQLVLQEKEVLLKQLDEMKTKVSAIAGKDLKPEQPKLQPESPKAGRPKKAK